MKFKRSIYKDLIEWQKKPNKKPLFVMGARQISETTILKNFDENEYKDFVFLNLERQKDIHGFFEGNKDPRVLPSTKRNTIQDYGFGFQI